MSVCVCVCVCVFVCQQPYSDIAGWRVRFTHQLAFFLRAHQSVPSVRPSVATLRDTHGKKVARDI